MIILNPNKTTGKQLYRIIMRAVVTLRKKHKEDYTKVDLCREARFSRMALYRWQNGAKPSADSLLRLHSFLNEKGIETKMEW